MQGSADPLQSASISPPLPAVDHRPPQKGLRRHDGNAIPAARQPGFFDKSMDEEGQ